MMGSLEDIAAEPIVLQSGGAIESLGSVLRGGPNVMLVSLGIKVTCDADGAAGVFGCAMGATGAGCGTEKIGTSGGRRTNDIASG
jgi:hypothetical protein